MTLTQFAGMDAYGRDMETLQLVSHREKYDRVISGLGGVDAIQPYIPYPIDTLRKAYAKDIYFNTLPMRHWDRASGFIVSLGNCRANRSARIWDLYRQHDITAISNAESVCLLKEAARILVEQESAVALDDL